MLAFMLYCQSADTFLYSISPYRCMEMIAKTFSIMKPFGTVQQENIVSSLANFLALSSCVEKMQSGLQCVTHTAVGRSQLPVKIRAILLSPGTEM